MADMELIKRLRAMTQAGVMDAKKALEENNNNLDEAAKWLREKGIIKAAKKASAVATEGVVKILTHHKNEALIIEINSQTDFVAMSEEFKRCVDEVSEVIYNNKPQTIEQALTLTLPNKLSINDYLIDLTAKLGEKISIRRFEILKTVNNDVFSSYIHTNNKIGVLLICEGQDEKAMHEVAMHGAAMNPKFLSRENVDQTWLASETEILKTQTIAEGKPADKAEMIVKGRVQKMLAEVCLIEQPFFKEPQKTIGAYLKEHGCICKKYIRYEVGEGIEKKQTNFADEVAAQMQQK